MDINYWWLSLFIAIMIILVIWLIKKNLKDEKAFEKEAMQSELKPGEDNDLDEQSPNNV